MRYLAAEDGNRSLQTMSLKWTGGESSTGSRIIGHSHGVSHRANGRRSSIIRANEIQRLPHAAQITPQTMLSRNGSSRFQALPMPAIVAWPLQHCPGSPPTNPLCSRFMVSADH